MPKRKGGVGKEDDLLEIPGSLNGETEKKLSELRKKVSGLLKDLSQKKLAIEERESALEECRKARTELQGAVGGLASKNSKLVERVRQLLSYLELYLPLGELPYSLGVFASFSEFDDGRRDAARKTFGMGIDFRKCYVLSEGGRIVLGTAGKDVMELLKPGQVVYVNGNQSIIGIVPENEVMGLSCVSEGKVERILNGKVIVSSQRGFETRGVIYSDVLSEKLKEKPLEAGDTVLLFGPCILEVLERSSEEKKKVNIKPVKLSDIGGLDEKIQEIRDAMGLDFDEEAKQKMRREEGRGVVLYGPPGVGKTTIVRGLASELRWNFVLFNGADFESMWVGMSQKELRNRLDGALKNKPAIVFFDEVEAAFPVRGASLGQEHKTDNLAAFNTFMDGVEDTTGVFVVFGSNRIDKVDPAVIRSGRMDKKIYIPRPNRKSAGNIFRIYLPRHPVGNQVNKEEFADRLIKLLVDEIYLIDSSTHLFTAYRHNEGRDDYFFKHFASGALIKSVVQGGVENALKRLKENGVSHDNPDFGIIEEDFEGVVSRKFVGEIPADNRSRNEWLMVNGYRPAEAFREKKKPKRKRARKA